MSRVWGLGFLVVEFLYLAVMSAAAVDDAAVDDAATVVLHISCCFVAPPSSL